MAPHLTSVDRRGFLAHAALALLAGHQSLTAAASSHTPAQRSPAAPRLAALDLLTAATLDEMAGFYGSLGLPIAARSADAITIAAGGTALTFRRAPDGGDRPFYHFAFNIPENKIVEALAWQRARGPLLPIPERNRDPKMPPEVVDYRHWNAHSIFFLDPGGNVVEYIARHDLKNASGGGFSPRDILYASEIAFIVDDVPAACSIVRDVAAVDQYRGGDAQFTALGDEEGLLLIMKRGRVLNFQPQSDEKAARVYETAVRIRGAATRRYSLSNFPYTLTVEP
jgi:hypothetical protein